MKGHTYVCTSIFLRVYLSAFTCLPQPPGSVDVHTYVLPGSRTPRHTEVWVQGT